jgi:hypothetical protein
LHSVDTPLRAVGKTIYRKIGGDAHGS